VALSTQAAQRLSRCYPEAIRIKQLMENTVSSRIWCSPVWTTLGRAWGLSCLSLLVCVLSLSLVYIISVSYWSHVCLLSDTCLSLCLPASICQRLPTVLPEFIPLRLEGATFIELAFCRSSDCGNSQNKLSKLHRF